MNSNCRPNSKPVSAENLVKTETLLKISERFSVDTYKRPIEDEGKLRSRLLEACGQRELVLDSGCGVGESSYHLALEHSNSFVLGVDKSLSRIERKNRFKKDLPDNMLLLKADMQSVWPLLYKMQKDGEVQVSKQYILYPNPWPKIKGLKKRWYANPMLAFILGLDCEIEIRSNWKNYLEDFEKVFLHLKRNSLSHGVKEFLPKTSLTPFEKKYGLSGQTLYQLVLEP